MEKMHPEFLRRTKLLEDSVTCERVDKIMVAPFYTYLPITLYKETTIKDTIKDWRNAIPSYIRYHEEYQPDLAYGPEAIFPGPAMDALDCKFVRWPGKHFDDSNVGFQVLDEERMDPEEFLEYAEDPSGFYLRKILPRTFGKMDGLKYLDFSQAIWHEGMYACLPFVMPEVKESLNAMTECGEKLAELVAADAKMYAELANKGFPCGADGVTSAPFDVFNDTLRGFINMSTDVYEYPDEVKVAVDAATKMQVRYLKNLFKQRPIKIIGFMLHNGFDKFMNKENFEEFYWPGLKACIDVCIENNVIPWVYVEDSYMTKLDIIERDVPAHKCIFTFTGSNDMEKVKERFAGKYCFKGGVKGTLLEYGSIEDVEKAVKHAIDVYAPGGGFILDCDVTVDTAKAENLRAFFETARNYMKH